MLKRDSQTEGSFGKQEREREREREKKKRTCNGMLLTPKHEEFESSWEWVGLKFNPLKFYKKAVEKELAKLNAHIQEYESGFN
jgi:hypothetical protein